MCLFNITFIIFFIIIIIIVFIIIIGDLNCVYCGGDRVGFGSEKINSMKGC